MILRQWWQLWRSRLRWKLSSLHAYLWCWEDVDTFLFSLVSARRKSSSGRVVILNRESRLGHVAQVWDLFHGRSALRGCWNAQGVGVARVYRTWVRLLHLCLSASSTVLCQLRNLEFLVHYLHPILCNQVSLDRCHHITSLYKVRKSRSSFCPRLKQSLWTSLPQLSLHLCEVYVSHAFLGQLKPVGRLIVMGCCLMGFAQVVIARQSPKVVKRWCCPYLCYG